MEDVKLERAKNWFQGFPSVPNSMFVLSGEANDVLG